MKIISPLDSLDYRTKDSFGDGYFGASRTDRTHKGVDIISLPGEPVYAPTDGVITKLPFPYAGNSKYKGIDVTKDNVKVRMFYVSPIVTVGQTVKKGELIGHAQNIAEKFGEGMTNHIHLEYFLDGTQVDPKNYLRKKLKWLLPLLIILIALAIFFRLKKFKNE